MFKLNNITVCDCYLATTARKRKAKQVQKGSYGIFLSQRKFRIHYFKNHSLSIVKEKIPKLKVIYINNERYKNVTSQRLTSYLVYNYNSLKISLITYALRFELLVAYNKLLKYVNL